MFTDGLPEAMSPEKKIFGIERIKDVLKETWHLSVQEILDAFYKALDIHAANSAQHDDTTIIVLKAK
jgi:sigma-B regulation protein RsbU (phosphoserine phosphatase)